MSYPPITIGIMQHLSRVLLAGLALLAVGLGSAFFVLHDALLSVQTASMVPTFRPGDALVVRGIRPAEINVGDVISYRNPKNITMIITHRLIGRTAAGQLITRGDNAQVADPPFAAQLFVGKAVAVIPDAGRVLDVLHTKRGLVVAVYVPAGLIIASEVWRLTRLGQPTYQAPHYRQRMHGV